MFCTGYPVQVGWVMSAGRQQPTPDRINEFEVDEPRPAWQIKVGHIDAVFVFNDLSEFGDAIEFTHHYPTALWEGLVQFLRKKGHSPRLCQRSVYRNL